MGASVGVMNLGQLHVWATDEELALRAFWRRYGRAPLYVEQVPRSGVVYWAAGPVNGNGADKGDTGK